MSLQTPELSVEIAVSSMDLYPIDLPGRPSWGSRLEQMEPYLVQTGCRNFEVVPTDALTHDVSEHMNRGDTEPISRIIGSVHQSFNSGGDMLGRISDWRGVHRSQPSIQTMAYMAEAGGRPVPAVHYPETLTKGSNVISAKAIYPIMQPCAEIYRDFGVYSNSELLRAMARLGIVGLCPDTVHARRQAADGSKTPPISEVWADQFASGAVYQMHIGADRIDMSKRDPELAAKSLQEFRAFTSRRWQDARNTEMGDMITAAIENWVPPAALARAAGRPVLRQVLELPPRPGAILHRVKDHARFVENLTEVVRETGATPLLWGDTA